MTWFLMKYMLMFGGVALAIYVIGRALFGQQRTDDAIAELEHQALDAAWRKVFHQHGAPTEETVPAVTTFTDPLKGPVTSDVFRTWLVNFRNSVYVDDNLVKQGVDPAVHFVSHDFGRLLALK
jgi:hypothetical protein